MKKSKRLLALSLAAVMVAGMLTGCGNAKKTDATLQETTVQAQEETTEKEETKEETLAEVSKEREITDMAGRTMTIPAEIKSVFSAGPAAAIYLYTLVPDRLLGWNYELNEVEKSVILEQYHSIPNFGMGDAVNYEAVIAADPTIALNVGTINEKMVSDCDALSKSLGIPVVAVDGDLMAAPEAYRFMGELFGEEETAEKLAAYAEKTFQDIENMNIPDEEKVRIYYGNGEDSLETAPVGSPHAQIIEMVNGINVAELEMGEGGRIQISAEQLLAWDPDVIIVNGEPKADITGASAAESILGNPDYASLKAVKNEAVYGTPNAPFSWIDRPNGPNRIVGIRWLSGLIYPEYLNFNVDEEVKEFFQLFRLLFLLHQKSCQCFGRFMLIPIILFGI